MNRYKSLTAAFVFTLLILGLSTAASAQWRDNRRNDDYYGNGRYNRSLNSAIRDLRSRSRNFERRLDRELDRSRLDGTRREDRINEIASQFARAAERLDREYDDRRDYRRSQDEARRVLQLGSQLERALGGFRLSSGLRSDWNRIRQDLRVLSNAFGGYYNGGYRDNRRGRIRFPF
jgi:very-short-patch-repair endonuclease